MLPLATRPRRIAILGDAAGTVARAYGHYYPQTRVDAVELDGELSTIGKRYFDLRGPQPASLHRRRAAVDRREHGPLRRDLPGRLPPALHPVLPRHPGVLQGAHAAPESWRGGDRQRRPHPRLGRAGEGRLGDARRGLRGGRPRRRQCDELAGRRERRTMSPRAGRRHSPGWRRRSPGGSANHSLEARSTPTTAPRSSGSPTSRSFTMPPAGGNRGTSGSRVAAF